MDLRRMYLANTRKPIPKSKVDYGSIVEINYNTPDGLKKYDVLVLHPRLAGKIFHCLDLDLVDDEIFQKFLDRNMETDIEILYKKLTEKKGLLKPNVRIGTSFYETKIKKDSVLMKDRPYKTFKLDKIRTIKYIPYGDTKIIKEYNEFVEKQQLNDNESTQL